MNFKKITLVLLCSLCTLLAADNKTTKVTPQQMAHLLAGATELTGNMSESERMGIEKEIKKCEQEQIELGALKDKNRIGSAEFEQRRTMLEGKINRLQQKLTVLEKRIAHVDESVQGILMGGWNTALKVHEEETKRKSEVARIAVSSAIHNEGRLEQLKYLTEFASNPATLGRTGAFLLSTLAGSYMIKYSIQYAFAQFSIPPIVQESSIAGFTDSVFNALWGKKEKDLSFFDDIILPDSVSQQLMRLAAQIKKSRERGLPYRHLLLYGAPGTGKTMFARKLAHYADMDYMIIPAGNFEQYKKDGQHVVELNKLFRCAKKTSRGLILFFDEGEAILGKKTNLEHDDIQFLNTFLAHTGASAHADDQAFSLDGMIVVTTNNPGELDPAVLSRFQKPINFPLPGVEERKKMVNLYFDLYITKDVRINKRTNEELRLAATDDISPQFLEQAACAMDGWVGREVEQMFDELRSEAYGSDDLVVTKELFNLVFEEKKARHHSVTALSDKK